MPKLLVPSPHSVTSNDPICRVSMASLLHVRDYRPRRGRTNLDNGLSCPKGHWIERPLSYREQMAMSRRAAVLALTVLVAASCTAHGRHQKAGELSPSATVLPLFQSPWTHTGSHGEVFPSDPMGNNTSDDPRLAGP